MGEDRAVTPPARKRVESTSGKALYRGLRPGPHGSERSREQVRRHQRLRLIGAMIEAVHEHGYEKVSVQQVVSLAGVSKRTFYEHFSCKEECFLMTFDTIDLDVMRRLTATYSELEDREAHLRVLLEWVFANVANRPKESRLRMIEAYAAGPPAHARVKALRARIEAVLASSLPKRAENPPPIVVKGMAHGLWHLLCARLLSGRVAELPKLTDEVYAWMASYRCLDGALPQAPGLVRRQRSAGRGFKAPVGDERRLLQHAALHIVGRRGWPALSRASLLELAGVDERRFDALYGDVEDCFIEALDLLAAEALAPMLSAARNAPREWTAGVQASMAALVRALADDPVFARAAFVEAAFAGPRGVERANRLLDGFAALLQRNAPSSSPLTLTASQAIAGAVWGIVHDYVHAGAGDRLPELAPHLSYIVLAPAVGPEAAIESIERFSAREQNGCRGVPDLERRATPAPND